MSLAKAQARRRQSGIADTLWRTRRGPRTTARARADHPGLGVLPTDGSRARLGEGRVLNTPGLFLLGIRAGILTVDAADRMKAVLERHRFKMRFSSFRELVDE